MKLQGNTSIMDDTIAFKISKAPGETIEWGERKKGWQSVGQAHGVLRQKQITLQVHIEEVVEQKVCKSNFLLDQQSKDWLSM